MMAFLVAGAITVLPLPPPKAEVTPETPVDVARAWLEALRDGEADRLPALTAYPFRWAMEWRPHEIPRKGPRRAPRPLAGHHEKCPLVVKGAPAMAAWLTCMWRDENLLVAALVRNRGAGGVLPVALEKPAGPSSASAYGHRHASRVVASFSYLERTFTIRVGMRSNDDLGSTYVREMLVTVDYQYDEERRLWEEREKERHRKPPID